MEKNAINDMVSGIIVSRGNIKSLLTRLKAIKETYTMSITQKCSYDTCEYKQATKYRTTYCSAHYWREKESRDMSKPIIVSRKGMTAYERVMCQIEKRGDCLIFTGYKMKNGYGTVTSLGGDRKILAHRAVIQHHRGE